MSSGNITMTTTSDTPVASIVVPSFNRPKQLAACLKALTRQEGITYEVIIVDDGSPTPLEPICAQYSDIVTCIRQDNAGPAAARNRGVDEARGSFVALTDDDCQPEPTWLAKLVEAHAGREDVMVGGRVENGLPRDVCATASQDLCDYLYQYFDAASGDAPFFTSNNIGLSRTAFKKIGGFDQTFPLAAGEDRDFGLRWREQGGQLVYVNDAVINHFHAMTLSKFWRQHSNYGRGAHHLHGVLAARGSDTPKREPLGFYINLVLHPLKARGLRGIAHAALMALSQFAMVNGYSRENRASRN